MKRDYIKYALFTQSGILFSFGILMFVADTLRGGRYLPDLNESILMHPGNYNFLGGAVFLLVAVAVLILALISSKSNRQSQDRLWTLASLLSLAWAVTKVVWTIAHDTHTKKLANLVGQNTSSQLTALTIGFYAFSLAVTALLISFLPILCLLMIKGFIVKLEE